MMRPKMSIDKLAKILLIEDNEGDVELAIEAFEDAKFRNLLMVATDLSLIHI